MTANLKFGLVLPHFGQHASVEKCLDRLDRLAMRNGVPSDPVLIAQAVQLVILLAGDNDGRRVVEMVRVVEQQDRRNPYVLRRFDEQGKLP